MKDELSQIVQSVVESNNARRNGIGAKSKNDRMKAFNDGNYTGTKYLKDNAQRGNIQKTENGAHEIKDHKKAEQSDNAKTALQDSIKSTSNAMKQMDKEGVKSNSGWRALANARNELRYNARQHSGKPDPVKKDMEEMRNKKPTLSGPNYFQGDDAKEKMKEHIKKNLGKVSEECQVFMSMVTGEPIDEVAPAVMTAVRVAGPKVAQAAKAMMNNPHVQAGLTAFGNAYATKTGDEVGNHLADKTVEIVKKKVPLEEGILPSLDDIKKRVKNTVDQLNPFSNNNDNNGEMSEEYRDYIHSVVEGIVKDRNKAKKNEYELKKAEENRPKEEREGYLHTAKGQKELNQRTCRDLENAKTGDKAGDKAIDTAKHIIADTTRKVLGRKDPENPHQVGASPVYKNLRGNLDQKAEAVRGHGPGYDANKETIKTNIERERKIKPTLPECVECFMNCMEVSMDAAKKVYDEIGY